MRVPSPCSGSRDGKLFVMSDANTLEVRGITNMLVLKPFQQISHARSILFDCFPMAFPKPEMHL